MIIAIASTRLPKVNGVKRAIENLRKHFPGSDQHIRFETIETPSGVSDTPTSIDELMKGAQHRATAIFDPAKRGQMLTVGVEGGLFIVNDRCFLQSWCCVYNGSRYSFGGSGSIEIPPVLRNEVLVNNVDLGIAIDRFARQSDVRSKQGTFGILTNDIITREDSFALSALNAFMPFFHEKIYGASGAI